MAFAQYIQKFKIFEKLSENADTPKNLFLIVFVVEHTNQKQSNKNMEENQ